MRLIRPLLAAAGVALFGSAAALHAFDLYLAFEVERFFSRHAAHGAGSSASPPTKLPAAVP